MLVSCASSLLLFQLLIQSCFNGTFLYVYAILSKALEAHAWDCVSIWDFVLFTSLETTTIYDKLSQRLGVLVDSTWTIVRKAWPFHTIHTNEELDKVLLLK